MVIDRFYRKRYRYVVPKFRIGRLFAIYVVILILMFPLIILGVFGEKEEISFKNNILEEPNKIKLYCNVDKKILELDFEEYVACVTYAEMPASFEVEALKAQAVAVRTYTYRKMSVNAHNDYDMCDDVNHCQAFRVADTSEAFFKVKKAVESTSGEIIVYNEEPIDAVFHSASGGFTESAVNVWSSNVAYLIGTESLGEDEIMKDFATTLVVSRKDFFNVLGMNSKKINPEIIKRSESGGVMQVKIGDKVFSGSEIRSLFGLRSTKFDIECDKDNIEFLVKGYGHGVGLSQWGAEAMARRGSTYEEIIKHYYSGVEITKYNRV